MKRSHNLLNTVKQSLNPINKISVGVSPLWQTPSLTSDPHDPYTVEKLSMRRTIWYPTHGHRTRPDPNPCPDNTESYIIGKISMWGVQRYHSHDPPWSLTYNNKRRNDTLEESQYPLTGMFRYPAPSIYIKLDSARKAEFIGTKHRSL
jgi:hypothetical protein